MCVILFLSILNQLLHFAVTQYPEVKIEFGKNALAISGAVSNLAQHPHQQEARRGEKGDGETNHAIKSEMSNNQPAKGSKFLFPSTFRGPSYVPLP